MLPNKDFDNTYVQVENKLLLLYLLDRMDLPMSNTQISDFSRQENIMDIFALQQSLAEMVDAGYLDPFRDNNNTRYTVTDEGLQTLEFFEKHIPIGTRNKINRYVNENRQSVKKDFEVTATNFYDHVNSEFIVKCGIYEDERMLMELSVSVVSREQARLICSNWKKNVNVLYKNIIDELISPVLPQENLSAENLSDENLPDENLHEENLPPENL